ncbi:substrate-binding periplasmic protein [Chitinilyticum piscinae]|uniref:Transporter substrate-binding domain-containing protein n=1 Tax=Chitinilyticum piscinae TaxID=2866724 RepID=A0A8J7FIC0_9NEIS|nr:transporter substrate-binding domain-containing protein [Chitinilyticum piscinae]MBE9607917.1 transporter substrate-binding domain-containing protein [Chitinilyticum piscinae]
MTRILLAGLALLWALLGHAAAVQHIPLYTYYDDSPFGLAHPDNLTADLADYLSDASQGRYRFEPVQLPRKRLDQELEKPDWQGVVAWGNPDFFSNLPLGRLRWTGPYSHDADLIVSSKSRPVDYRGPESLTGLTFGAILGRQLGDLTPAIQAGKIRREDATSQSANLRKLQAGRIDVTQLQQSALPHLRREYPELDRWLYISQPPRDVFTRHLGVNPANTELYDFLQSAIRGVPKELTGR